LNCLFVYFVTVHQLQTFCTTKWDKDEKGAKRKKLLKALIQFWKN